MTAGDAIKSFSAKFGNYLHKHHRYRLKHNKGKKGPDANGPIIQFPGGDTQFWRLWWKVRENQMIMELGRENAPKGKNYLGLAERLDLPNDVVLERAEDSASHPKTDYLILPTKPVDLTAEFYDQIDVVENAIRQALRLVEFKDPIRNQMMTRDAGSAHPDT